MNDTTAMPAAIRQAMATGLVSPGWCNDSNAYVLSYIHLVRCPQGFVCLVVRRSNPLHYYACLEASLFRRDLPAFWVDAYLTHSETEVLRDVEAAVKAAGLTLVVPST